jgi:hypothetical protein
MPQTPVANDDGFVNAKLRGGTQKFRGGEGSWRRRRRRSVVVVGDGEWRKRSRGRGADGGGVGGGEYV